MKSQPLDKKSLMSQLGCAFTIYIDGLRCRMYVIAVDLLGGPIHRRRHRRRVPPVRPPGQRRQARVLPEQRLSPAGRRRGGGPPKCRYARTTDARFPIDPFICCRSS